MRGTLVFIDLDGTLFDVHKVLKKAGKEPNRKHHSKHQRWVKKVVSKTRMEAAIPGMPSIIKQLYLGMGSSYFLTSRAEAYRSVTTRNAEKLLGGNILPRFILMRPENDKRTYARYKEASILKMLINSETENDVIVIDDDPDKTLQKVCKKRGWTLLKCLGGSL